MSSRSSVAGVVGVAVLTCAALALRFGEIQQSLFGDELFTYRIVTEHGLWTLFAEVADTDINPPGHYLLGWMAVQLGDPTVTIRLPSVVLGTAVVPLVYAVGVRTVGRTSAFVGALIVAISPFAIFYSVESRSYAALAFFSALSTLTLLWALQRSTAARWIAYGLASVAVLLTHYTGVFVVLGQLGWALWAHRPRARELMLVHGGIALAYVPWIPSLLQQGDLASDQAADTVARFPPTIETVAEMAARFLPGAGEPSFLVVPLDVLPGTWLVWVFWVTVAIALAAAIARVLRHRPWDPRRAPGLALVLVLGLVTPFGLVLYSLQPDTSLLIARNLSASMPALSLLIAWLLTSLRAPMAGLAVLVVAAALTAATAQTLADEHQRPAYRQVAEFIEREAADGDVVVQPLGSDNVLSEPLPVHLGEAHPILGTDEDRRSWVQAAGAEHVFIVAVGVGTTLDSPPNAWRSPLGDRFSLESHELYAGAIRVGVSKYSRMRGSAN